MLVTNVTDGTITLERAAIAARVLLVKVRPQGLGIEFTLGPAGETWRRKGNAGQRVGGVCWHGHRAFMEELFKRSPNTVLKSHMATYRGRIEFYAEHDATGNRNIGSVKQPLAYRRACDCPVEVS